MSPGTEVCALCADNFIVNTRYIKCDRCVKFYHLVCVRVKEQLLKFKQELSNIKWFCNSCLSGVEASLKNPAEEINSREILERTEKLINLIQKQQPKFSDVVKNNVQPPLIIRPKNSRQDSAVTKNVLEQKINPADIAASVSKIKQVSNGCVVVQCENKQSLESFKKQTENTLGRDYEITTAKMLNPKIKILNVKEEQLRDTDQFLTNLTAQNLCDDLNKNIKCIKKYKTPKNREGTCNVILELNTEQFTYLTNKSQFVYVEWNKYKYFEFISVLRCFKCWKFGHRAERCTSVVVCPLCSQNHKKEECKSLNFECVNCKYAKEVIKITNITTNHHVFDTNCPSYQRQIDSSKNKIEYNI